MPTLDLLDLLSAIGSAEGYFTPGTVPARCNNPGDLRFAGQFGAVPSTEGGKWDFAKFDRPERGVIAGLRQLCADIQRGDTLTQLVYTWAPPGDGNNSALYLSETIRRIKSVSGLDIEPNVPLWNYLTIRHIP